MHNQNEEEDFRAELEKLVDEVNEYANHYPIYDGQDVKFKSFEEALRYYKDLGYKTIEEFENDMRNEYRYAIC